MTSFLGEESVLAPFFFLFGMSALEPAARYGS